MRAVRADPVSASSRSTLDEIARLESLIQAAEAELDELYIELEPDDPVRERENAAALEAALAQIDELFKP